MKAILATTALALALVGCVTPSQPQQKPHSNTHQKPPSHQGHTQHFECDNGLTAIVKYLNADQIHLTVQNYQAVLTLAPSASGARYVTDKGLFGYGGEWHQKGTREAFFSYKGVHGSPGDSICKVE